MMSIEEQIFLHTNTYVFWDIEDFPIHKDEIYSFERNVQVSLKNEGYLNFGKVRIKAYGHREHSSPMKMESLFGNMGYLTTPVFRLSSRYARLNSILVDMINDARHDHQANFMLIIKGISEEDTEVVSVIKELKKRNYKVLLVVGDDEDKCAYYPLEVLSSFTVWRWTSLLGGCPIRPTTCEEDEEEDDSDTSDYEDDYDTSDEEGSSENN